MKKSTCRATVRGASLLLSLFVSLGAAGCADDLGMAQVEPTALRGISVQSTLVASGVVGQARTFAFVAQIEGASDSEPALYCQPTTWDFGDGPPLTVTPSCAPWTPDVKIPRRFEQTHTYDAPGSYTVTFTYGPLSRRVTVEVR